MAVNIQIANTFGITESPFVKALTGVPVIGSLVFMGVMVNLSSYIHSIVTGGIARAEVDARKLLVEYVKIGIGRELLTAALLITAIALQILPLTFLVSAGIFIGIAVWSFAKLLEPLNKEIQNIERRFL